MPKRQDRFRLDFEEPNEGIRVPALPSNTPVDLEQHLQLEENEFAISAPSVAREIGNKFEEVFQEGCTSAPAELEATIEELIKDAFQICTELAA